MIAQETNHYPLFRKGTHKRTACMAIVSADRASATTTVTCPDCRSRLAAKAQAELEQAMSLPAGQERDFHQATARTFLALARSKHDYDALIAKLGVL